MLTDIFAHRYKDHAIWTEFSELERRLLIQIYNLIKQVIPYYHDGKEIKQNVEKYKKLHDLLSNEIGQKSLATRYYSYTAKNFNGIEYQHTGCYTYEQTFEHFLTIDFNRSWDVDAYMKTRISLVELVMREREIELAKIKNNLAFEISVSKNFQSIFANNKQMNDVFHSQVEELNERFQRAKAPLSYHNGLIQITSDHLIEREISKPFWSLVSEPKWKNVDIDMKEALDQRDSNGKDPAFYAAKALESTIKIISNQKGWTHGKERGAANYIDNLMKHENAFLADWEGEMLKAYFTKIRNEVGHGPGSKPMPTLTSYQTDFAIEAAMSWIKTMILRLDSSGQDNS